MMSFKRLAILVMTILSLSVVAVQAQDEEATCNIATTFADPAMDDAQPAYVAIRIYEGVDPENRAEFIQIVNDGFLPIMEAADGFVAYMNGELEDSQWVAISVFDNEEAALASNEQAADFVAESLAALLPEEAPTAFNGVLELRSFNFCAEEGNDVFFAEDVADASYVAIRIYGGVDSENRTEFVQIVNDGFLPIMQESESFVAYMNGELEDSQWVAISVFDNEEAALASNEQAADFVAESLAALLPEEAPTAFNGVLELRAFAAETEE